MINQLLNNSTIGVLEQVVNFTQARHGVLAGNIANLDTPGYQSRDLSVERFEQSLKQALEAESKPQSLGGQTVPATTKSLAEIGASMDSLLYHDGSDVSLEQQITEISKNHGKHNLAISLMTAQFRQLESAISERVI
ncbi:MAG: flagellar basal body rod protein FlgB [Planctomycetota bacterium]